MKERNYKIIEKKLGNNLSLNNSNLSNYFPHLYDIIVFLLTKNLNFFLSTKIIFKKNVLTYLIRYWTLWGVGPSTCLGLFMKFPVKGGNPRLQRSVLNKACILGCYACECMHTSYDAYHLTLCELWHPVHTYTSCAYVHNCTHCVHTLSPSLLSVVSR